MPLICSSMTNSAPIIMQWFMYGGGVLGVGRVLRSCSATPDPKP